MAPGDVLPNQAFVISANIEGATTATLIYKIGFDGPELSVAMTNIGSTWTATLPGQDASQLIRYRNRSDVHGVTEPQTWPDFNHRSLKAVNQ